jgi:hypothetical protein
MYSVNIYTFIVAALVAIANSQTTTDPVTGTLGNATVVENNPPGLIYTATLPSTPFFTAGELDGNVKGSISATANPNGIGVSFSVNFENLPTSGGPFSTFSLGFTFTLLTQLQVTIFMSLLFPKMAIAPRPSLTLILSFVER